MAAVRIVLVRPENSANVGAAARVVTNMGLAGLDLVSPGDWRTVETWRMAWRAEDTLEQARVFPSLEEALTGAVYTAGLTGRPGHRVRPITVRAMAKEIAALAASSPVSILFGPESKGLTERDLLLCQRRVRIPSHPAQPSLNLAQAVMVAAYEIFVTGCNPDASLSQRAEQGEMERALGSLREAMLEIGFLPADNPEARFVEWRDLFGRAGLSSREVKLILALARRIRGARKGPQRK
ncbi:MAG TPA: TrmH family RNA methyltransferase [Vicinamibacteria bacterium]|nr:TrmH family RNA methyltransferase [Vicinamibacteria bacterium]